mmetsp:Transcript_37231/g.77993  ORF Transcript_37231/g.77993 Transcript_37231/m.77993 type:complete len:437 (+) Transcript_37231:128-1438(+)
MRNVMTKAVAATRSSYSCALRSRSSMQGMTPAWKRHCIRQKRKKTSCTNSSPNSAVATAAATATATTATKTTAITSPSQQNTNFAMIVDQVKSFSIGTFAGLLGSLVGMGGGFVMIPMMTAARSSSRRATAAAAAGVANSSSASKGSLSSSPSWMGGLGLHQHQAHGTSLFAVGTTGLAGALGYGIHVNDDDDTAEVTISSQDDDGNDTVNNSTGAAQTRQSSSPQSKGLVQLDTALALAATAMVTARFGAIASSRLSEKSLQKALGAFMMFVAPLVPGKAYLDAYLESDDDATITITDDPSDPDVQKKHAKSQMERLIPASLIGTFSGFLSGMFGVGGGAIVVPALVLSTDMSHHSALGTSLCAMVLPAMVGVWTHSTKGNVNWRVAPLLAVGSAVGAFWGGSEVGLNLDEGVLRGGFSCLMLVLGARTWRKGAR